MPSTDTRPERLAYSVAEAAEALNIGTSTLREFIRRGIVPATKLGGRVLISKTTLESLLTGEVASDE